MRINQDGTQCENDNQQLYYVIVKNRNPTSTD